MTTEPVDPGEDAALLEKTATELRAFVRGVATGAYTTNPVAALAAAIDRLKMLEPLDDFVRLSNLADKAASPLGVKADELNAHWKLAFYRRPGDREGLLDHAGHVTLESVGEGAAAALAARKVVDDYRRKMDERGSRHQDYPHLAERHGLAAAEFQRLYQAFLGLVGVPDEPFDPDHRYVDEWKRFVRISEAKARVKHRGLDPNAKAAKAFRTKRGWTQAQLVAEVRDRTGIKLSIRTIRRVEAGKRVDFRTLEAIAKTLEQDLSALVL